MKNKNIHLLILIFWGLIFITLQFLWIYNTPLSGDGSYHTQFFKQNYENSTITYLHDYLFWHYGFPRIQQFSLNYPPLYHTLWGLLYGFFETKTSYVIDAIIGFSIILLFSLLFTNKKIYYSIFPLLLLNSGFYVAGWNNNIILTFAVLLIIATVYRYSQTQNAKYLVLFIAFSIFWFGTKQLFYFVYPLLYLYIFFLTIKYWHFKKIIASSIVILIWILPLLFWQINNTWTISTQTIQWWPYIDKHIFKPRHFEIESWQTEIDNIVNIDYLNKISARHYYSINRWLDQIDLWFIENLFFLTYSNLPAAMKQHNNIVLILTIFAIVWIWKLFSNNKKLFTIVLLSLIGGFIPYKMTSRIEYSLIISIMLTFLWLYWLSYSTKNNSLKIIVLCLLCSMFFINTFTYTQSQKSFLDITYFRVKKSDNDSLKKLLYFLKTDENIDSTKLILHNNSQEFPFQSEMKTFWDFRLNFLSEDDFQKYLPNYKEKGWKYTLVFKKSVFTEFRNWWSILESSYFYKSLKNEEWFKNIYENDDFILYEFDDNYNNINQTLKFQLEE